MDVTITERPGIKAIALKTNRNGRDVRSAWKELQETMQIRNLGWVHQDIGYVFIPEWQWAAGIEELWVGVEVDTFVPAHEGLEQLTIPKRDYARIKVYGDREHMDKTYHFLGEWFKESGNERDYCMGTYGFEANRLTPVNPFDIPADTINFFDFDIFAPILKIHD